MKHLSKFFSAVLLLVAMNANAAIVLLDLEVEVIDGPGLGTIGTLTVEYDDALVDTSGEFILSNPDFSLSMDIFGQIFTNADDIDFPGLPALLFFDGILDDIDFIIADASFGVDNPTTFLDTRIGELSGAGVFDTGNGLIWEVVTSAPRSVSAPASMAIFALTIALVAFRTRK